MCIRKGRRKAIVNHRNDVRTKHKAIYWNLELYSNTCEWHGSKFCSDNIMTANWRSGSIKNHREKSNYIASLLPSLSFIDLPVTLTGASGLFHGHVVYGIKWTLCGLIYVGETWHTLRKRMNQPRYANKDPQYRVLYTHFNQPNNDPSLSMKVRNIEKIYNHTNSPIPSYLPNIDHPLGALMTFYHIFIIR